LKNQYHSSGYVHGYVQREALNRLGVALEGAGAAYFLVQHPQSFLVQGFSQQSQLQVQGSFSGILVIEMLISVILACNVFTTIKDQITCVTCCLGLKI